MMKEMKRMFKYFGFALAVAAGISCSGEGVLPEPVLEDGCIMIDVSSMPHTKAISADDLASRGAEAYVNHIDLFIFGEQEDGPSVYHERFSYSSPADPDTKALGVNKSRFVSGKEYDVYVIANSTESVESMAAVAGIDGLNALVQTDEFVYFTGLDEENVPEAFLMDWNGKKILNPAGQETEDITLEAELTRAAAKVVVELFEGTDGSVAVEFLTPDNTHVYHYRNLPYSTAVLSGISHSPELKSTVGHQINDYVKWDTEAEGETPNISVIGYVYAYDYSAQPMDKHTSLVVNIPIKIGADQYPANYYKIPLTNKLKFERNKMYRIKAKVNAPGAQTSFDPIEVEDLTYDVIDWADDIAVSVGGEMNKPQYLQLNTDHVDMYNVNEDASSLSFTSSSEITITLDRAYFIDYLDRERNLTGSLFSSIKAAAQPGVLNGNITITSPFINPDSHGNAIRYMEFTVKNKTGQTAKFTVSQYPTLYIDNVLGLYSYREDFSDRISGVSWSSNRWNYTNTASQGSFFASKVAVAGSGGNYSIRYANWNDGSYTSGTSLSMFNNPRMYHVHITATSKDYIVAKPKLDADGYTAATTENSRLVSPSFLIASQLGATETGGSYGGSGGVSIEKARRHCKEYMEVATDGTVYKDWRLPTKEEIDIISGHQHISDAMAEVLNGSHYYCAYNPEYETASDPNWKYTVRNIGTSNSTHVRCVHDSF